ncbi:unnamed protein product [Leptidea sinapis]|uniref:CRAL-TRIO domain-containing protein n=1 Tax=Leptidea sinapis TaxID=189913 RepID=A0A5E4QL73_9NEOP|nr:unnamed protein product [Leptidea sinapis]
MATSVLQPECRRDSKLEIPESPRLTDDERLAILEAKERETGDLPPELRERARQEIREEPALREEALTQMRHFIEKHPAIRKCRTACSMLERYLTIRQMYPQWFQKLDPLDPKIAAVIDAGYLVPLPKRDSEGRRINSTPMRHKRTHFVNIPQYGIKFFEFAISLLSDKLKDRVMFHRTTDDLRKYVDASILPKEYGGTVPLKDMIEELKRKLLKHREDLLALDDLCIDLHALGKNDLTQDIHSTAGSFRKLELD